MSRWLAGSLIFAVVGGARSLLAQDAPPPLKPFRPDDGKPVLRAQPVPKPTVLPAVPVATPIPNPPRPRATPKPAEPKTTPAASPEMTDPTGEIVLKPGVSMTPDQVQLSIADRAYASKRYDAAAPEYEKFLGLYPNTADKATVLFRLGESYRQTGAVNASKNSFETLLQQFSTGEFVGPAAYRLAELHYAEKNFAAAEPLYLRASVRLKDPKMVNSAKFFRARSLEGKGDKFGARKAYEDLLGQPQDNPFLDASRLSFALLLKDANNTAEALKQIQALAKQTENPELKAQATVYSGLWELELEHPRRAQEDLKTALEMPGIGKWKDIAQFGLVQMLFNNESYAQVIETYKSSGKEFGPDTRPQLLVLAAKAYRQLGKHAEAVAAFGQVIAEFPDSLYAKEAMYERLVSLYTAGDASLVAEIDKYLVANPEAQKRDQVHLMKAEMLFKKQDFAAAAPIYTLVAESRTLTGALKGEALSKLGWCYMQTREYDRAIKTYTSLIDGFPTVKAVPSALCQRALARLRQKELVGALKDFEELIRKHPKAKERELALQQKALIHGQQSDNTAMAETFGMLLKEFPNTPAAAEANYWVGWVAFENKDYKSAAGPLEKARELNQEEYFERASLRIMLSHYYLEDKEAVARALEGYAKAGGKAPAPYEVLHWLAHSFHDLARNSQKADAPLESYIDHLTQAAKWLGTLSGREDARADDFRALGDTFLLLREYQKALAPLQTYLEQTKDPTSRAEGLLALARAQIGNKELDAAQKTTDEAVGLQPDGSLNAEALIVAGDIQMARGQFEEAAKRFEGVSVVIDDEEITPRALEKAVEAANSAGKEGEAKRLLNILNSRYPEYMQRKRKP